MANATAVPTVVPVVAGVGVPAVTRDTGSSDGHIKVRIHDGWASALVWTDLTGTITVRRNGVDMATLGPARIVWYDHYPPLGVALAYTVTNGTTTSTAATVTVPADLRGRIWLKSGVDPNLSQLVTVTSLATVEYERHRGVFMPLQSGASTALRSPFIIEAGMSMRSRSLTIWTATGVARDAVLDLIAAGPLRVSFVPAVEESDMWASADSPTVTRGGTVSPNVGWSIETALTETSQPAITTLGDIIPGWGWDQVVQTWGSWNAEVAANARWLDLVKHGVTDVGGPASGDMDGGDPLDDGSGDIDGGGP